MQGPRSTLLLNPLVNAPSDKVMVLLPVRYERVAQPGLVAAEVQYDQHEVPRDVHWNEELLQILLGPCDPS